MKTEFPSQKRITRNWYVLDADSQVLGRLASRAAVLLMGKHKPTYTPFLDVGDHVVVVNAAKVRLTGRKEDQKIYRRHSGYPGGLKQTTARQVRASHPTRLVRDAIAGMLPKTKLGRHMLAKLKVYAGESHPHQAQKPVALSAVSGT